MSDGSSDDTIVAFPEPKPWEVEFGPERSGFTVIVDGRAIPGIHAYDRGPVIEFVLDGRFLYDVPREFSGVFASAVAQALAIGAGFSHLGAESRNKPFAPQVCRIDLDA